MSCVDDDRNTLVCDTMAEGKQLSWGQGPERHKVATLDGTVFAKAGSIAGGIAGDLAGRAQRWGDKEYETLKKVSCCPVTCALLPCTWHPLFAVV